MKYIMHTIESTVSTTRRRLATVLNEAGDIVRIEDAETALDITRTRAAKLLSRWMKQGWLRRVGRGVYVPVSIDMLASPHVLDDPWILVPALFDPAYIGGRSAAEHWDLTEQIFSDIVVLTGQPVREKFQQRHGALFSLKHTSEDKIFGTKTVWCGKSKIFVSDIHRTMIDILDDPALGGGIQYVADCLSVYLTHSNRDDDTLLGYAARLGNGAVFKRLGFLAERDPEGAALVDPCRDRLTTGHAKLDPALKAPRLITRWKLRVPQSWCQGGRA